MDCWFPDTTVLCNFAVVDRLDLLRSYLGARGRVVEAIEYEISRSARVVPNLDTVDIKEWFGKPIRFEKPGDRDRIDATRIGWFNGTSNDPLEHLGESQTLYAINNDKRFAGGTWITEDRAAYTLAKRQGIRTLHTTDVFVALVSNGELSAQEAFEICHRIHTDENERTLLVPPTNARAFE
jgi:hypothetical protein